MICQKYIARCYRVYQHERNKNASFLSILDGGGRPKWRFSNFPWFWKNSSALGSFNCIFENNSLKALFGQNTKKLKILKLSPDSRYLQKLALKLKSFQCFHFLKFYVTGHGENRFPLGFQLPVISHCLFIRLFRSSKDNSRLVVTSISLLF